MNIPLGKKLKKRMHLEIGVLQDEAVDLAYELDPAAVLHGGTAIWRCYNGNRFSEDLDFYASERVAWEEKFLAGLERRRLQSSKFKKTGNLIFSKVSDGNVEIRIEVNLSSKKNGTIRNYERMDGAFMNILTLSANELILEKISAYTNRRFIRDIYDIYHLSSQVQQNQEIKKEVRSLLSGIKPPVDEENLETLIYSGAVPSFKQMVELLKARF